MEKETLISELKQISKSLFNQKDFFKAGQINLAIDVLEETILPIETDLGKPLTNKIFEDYGLPILNEIEPDFTEKRRVHNWKNYVSTLYVTNWKYLTYREKVIIYCEAQKQADAEEWD